MRWTEAMFELLVSVDHFRVINCDETAWKVVRELLFTWPPVGKDSVESCVAASDKEAMTVLASVTAADEKLHSS